MNTAIKVLAWLLFSLALVCLGYGFYALSFGHHYLWVVLFGCCALTGSQVASVIYNVTIKCTQDNSPEES